MPTNHVIEVKIPRGKTACKVSRAVIMVKSRDRITFRNRTAGKIRVQISNDVYYASAVVLTEGRIRFDRHPHYQLVRKPMFKILPGNHLMLHLGKVHPGIYPYSVYCEQKARFCTGSSMPIIIVPK